MTEKNKIILKQEGGDNSKLYQSAGPMTVINSTPANNYNQYLKLVKEFEKEQEIGVRVALYRLHFRKR